MNLPNALSVTRIFLVPLLVVVLLTKFEGHRVFGIQKELVGAAIFGLASLTDWLDGYLARRRGQITALGQMIDPIADKLLTSAAFISLVLMDLAPAWMRGSSPGSMRSSRTPRPSCRSTPLIWPTLTPATLTAAPRPGVTAPTLLNSALTV
jgi:hypothetical protein